MRRLAVLSLIAAAAGCEIPGRWEYVVVEPKVHAVEQGRRTTYAEVGVRYTTGNPFTGGGGNLLVERCGPTPPPDGRPCWPDPRPRRQRTLRRILDRDAPAYLATDHMRLLLETINREVGPGRLAWQIGTWPIVLAFLDEPPDLEAYRAMARTRRRPTTHPLVEWKSDADGEVVIISDPRGRGLRRAGDADLGRRANVLLVYDETLDLDAARAAQSTPGLPAEGQRPARLIVLTEPRTLDRLIDDLADPAPLIRDAAVAVDLPVR